MPKLAARILYVDDEPSLRQTWPQILEQNGFQVATAGTTQEAERLVTARKFEVLLTDFDISRKGDGLLIAASFKIVNPDGVIIILTGYPDIDGAMSLIHAHIDAYLVKPTSIEEVIDTISICLERRQMARLPKRKRLEQVLRGETGSIQEEWLKQVKANAELAGIAISDEDRIDHLPEILRELSEPGETAHAHKLEGARRHGKTRRRQGYSVANLAEESRILRRTVFLILQRNLLDLDFSQLFPDLVAMTDSLEAQLKESLVAYSDYEKAA